ncbi:hypothetical protein K449DRAFT_469708 [Hypoxylon sp. EC38]|nr:hypothetical protein K449DRAFT_469708 [Hypoxylon sp. EC38]
MGLIPRQSLEGVIPPGVSPPGVSYSGFIGGVWAGVVVSGVILACRLVARFRGPGRIYWDDVLAISAFILVLITGAVWQWGASGMYYALNVQAGIEPFDETRFFPQMRRWLHASLIAELFFYTALLFIKLSFLLFFMRLGQGINFFRWVWWPVFFVTLASYFASMGDVDYKCLVGPLDTILQKCNTASSIHFVVTTLQVNCAFDILTDFLIMLLPAILLWRTQIQRTKKFAILGLFSLSVITMVIAIVRVATIGVTRRPDGNLDSTYLWLWTSIEPAVAIVVSCLSAFPQLFTQSSRNQKPAFTPSESRLRMMSRIRVGKNRTKNTWAELGSVTQHTTAFDHSRAETDVEATSQRSQNSQQLVLVPHTHRPVVYAYRGPSQGQSFGSEGQITHEVEFSVTK